MFVIPATRQKQDSTRKITKAKTGWGHS
jgi:hypothetical protein